MAAQWQIHQLQEEIPQLQEEIHHSPLVVIQTAIQIRNENAQVIVIVTAIKVVLLQTLRQEEGMPRCKIHQQEEGHVH